MGEAKKNTGESPKLLYGMAAFVITLWIGWWILVSLTTKDSGQAGQLGDLFGGINALFSGLAFATLIFTVHLQRHELSLQRQELADTREVLIGQRTQMELQNKTLAQQGLESTFFQWLSLHHDIVRPIRYGGQEGRAAFAKMHDDLVSTYLGNSSVEAIVSTNARSVTFDER